MYLILLIINVLKAELNFLKKRYKYTNLRVKQPLKMLKYREMRSFICNCI